MSFDRRTLVLAGAAVLIPASACAQTPRVYEIAIRRNVGCGCCRAWNTILQRTGRFTTTMTEDAELAAYKTSLGVPAELASCHTGLVEGYAIEGHVPPEEILRLIAERPAGVRGVNTPGSNLITSRLMGVIRDDPRTREEFLRLARGD